MWLNYYWETEADSAKQNTKYLRKEQTKVFDPNIIYTSKDWFPGIYELGKRTNKLNNIFHLFKYHFILLYVFKFR